MSIVCLLRWRPARATLLVAAARRKTPLPRKQQDGCQLAMWLLGYIFQYLRRTRKCLFQVRPRGRVPALTADRLHIVQCNKSVDRGYVASAAAATTVRSAFQSLPTPAVVGKISDLMTTGTAPEVSRMAPMSI